MICKPSRCHHCQRPLCGEDAFCRRHQVIDLPPIRPIVREYRLHTLRCPACGHETPAALPVGVPAGVCGPRLQAVVAICSGTYHLSKRQTQELLRDFFRVDISLGTVSQVETRVSAAVAAAVAEIHAAVRAQPVVDADETRWPQGNGSASKGYVWVAVTTYLACFLIRPGRDQQVAQELLGRDFAGILGSDRYAAYHWVPDRRRQFCWAHLRREWLAFSDRGGSSAVLGEQLLIRTDALFRWWHKLRDRVWSRPRFRGAMYWLRREVEALLAQGQHCAHARTAGTCAELLAHAEALWTFVDHEGVEPTNNVAERVLRPAVLWRRHSGGTRSATGSRFVERMLTVVTTCRLQGRNPLDYLTVACTAAVQGKGAPSLLPALGTCPSPN